MEQMMGESWRFGAKKGRGQLWVAGSRNGEGEITGEITLGDLVQMWMW